MAKLPQATVTCGQEVSVTHLCDLFSLQYNIMKNLNLQKSLKNCIENTHMPTT